MRKLIKRYSPLYVRLLARRFCNERNWRNGDTLVDNRHSELAFYRASGLHKLSCVAQNLIANATAALFSVRTSTVTQGNSHRNRADIELLPHEHIYSFLNLTGSKQHTDYLR